MGKITIFVDSNMSAKYFILCIAMSAVAIWSTIPLVVRLLTTMKRRSGLYFYAILVTSLGISVRQIGVLTLWLPSRCPWVIRRILVEAGSVAMVSGFSVVLYSRLSLIVNSHKVRRAVLIMMLFNGIIWHVAIITNNAGIRYLKNRRMKDQLPAWQRVHGPFEKTKVVMFSTQEIVISLFYVRAAYQYLQSQFNAHKGRARKSMTLLLLTQVIIIALDITIIVLDLIDYLQLKVIIHSFVYSVKLELEFVVLNQLIELSKTGVPGLPSIDIASTEGRVSPSDDEEKGAVAAAMKHKSSALRVASDSAVDLALYGSHVTISTLDFITTPQHMSLR